MFNILAMCDDYILGNIINIIKRTIDLLGIIVPIILIIGGTINLVKAVLNPDDKKAIKNIVNCFASGVIVFFLPFIINTTMKIIAKGDNSIGINENGKTETFSVSACWNNIKITETKTEMKKITATIPTIKEEENATETPNHVLRDLGRMIESNNNNSSSNNTSSGSGDSDSSGTSNTSSKKYDKVVLVGDSRFAGSNEYYHIGNEKTEYIAQVSQGLSYLKQKFNLIKQKDSDNAAFVINLGINDLGNVNNYISYINEMSKSIKGKIYYLSINPVEESKEGSQYSTTNKQINQFNEKMKAGLNNNSIIYLDSNSYLKANGYNTTDGIHYDKETSQKIYDYITKYVKS